MLFCSSQNLQRAFGCLLVATGVFFGGCTCSTDYRKFQDSDRVGYLSERKSTDTYLITYSGGSYSKPEQIKDFTLLRAAELTVENGFKYFAVIRDDDRSKKEIRSDAGINARGHSRVVNQSGRMATQRGYQIAPSTSYPVKIPVFALTIRLRRETDGAMPAGTPIHEAAPLITQLKTMHGLK